jgi:hypothetical protein
LPPKFIDPELALLDVFADHPIRARNRSSLRTAIPLMKKRAAVVVENVSNYMLLVFVPDSIQHVAITCWIGWAHCSI